MTGILKNFKLGLTGSLTKHACMPLPPALSANPSGTDQRQKQHTIIANHLSLQLFSVHSFIYLRYTNIRHKKCSLYICIWLGFVRLTTRNQYQMRSRPDSSKNSSREKNKLWSPYNIHNTYTRMTRSPVAGAGADAAGVWRCS